MQTIFNDRMDTKKLRQKILDLAIHGKLVPQNPNDEPASVLLERIRAEKERLIAEGKIKRSKKSATSDTSHYENVPFEVPKGWTKCCLYDIVSADCTLGYGIVQPMDDITDGVPVVRPVDLTTQIIRNNGLKRIDPTISEAYQRTILKGGEILFCVRASVGKLGIASPELKGANVTRGISPIRFDYESLTKYVFYHLQSFFSQNEIKHYSRGATLQQINVEDLKKLSIALPPLDEQKRIVNELEQWLQVCDIIEDSETKLMDSLSIIKNKILDLAIHGKLVPQDANDEPASELLKRINPKAVASCDNPHYEQIPDGWCVCTLEDIVDYEQPQAYIVHSTGYSDSYKIPVLTAGKSFIIGYTNEQNGICDNVPVIIFDDFTTDSKYVDFPFKVKSSAMKILHVKEGINIKYVAYFMSITRLIGDTHKRYWISEYSKVNIPLPPKAEQDRIVTQIERLMSSLDSIAESLV